MVAERRSKMEDMLFFLKKYGKDVVLVLLVLVCIALSCYNIFYNEETEVITNENLLASVEEEEISEQLENATIYVDIKGAVVNPGVYEVKDGSIVGDVITLAGGFLDDAYQDGINLSKRVSDEMVIYIYTTEEISTTLKTESLNPVINTEATCSSLSYDINDCVEKSESIIIPGDQNITTSEGENESSGLVNINTASQSELETLAGIGEARAQAIIEYRKSNGNFASIEDIMNVSGIGDAIFANIKNYITV